MFAKSQLFERYPQLLACRDGLEAALEMLKTCFEAGGKLLVAGNGGSSADAEHFCGELTKGFLNKRPLTAEQKALLNPHNPDLADKLQGGLPCVSLGVAHSFISAWNNDCDPVYVFAQQVWALAQPQDVLFVLSTSGRSRNIVHALEVARAKGIKSIALTGQGASPCGELADVVIHVPEQQVHYVQELHLPVYHALCIELEQAFFSAH